MLRRPSFWLIISLLCLGGAIYFWQQGEEKRLATQKTPPAAAPTEVKPASATNPQPAIPAATVKPAAATASGKSRYPYRLSNTDKTTDQLLRNPKAIHLMNALIDTAKPANLPIPDRLRAPKDNGSYIVQARGPLDNNFRAALQNAGATIISYVPNNAYLVRVSDAGAQQLASQAQSVLPFEPYYKLEPSLLQSVMENTALPSSALKVTLFPDASPSILTAMGINPTATDRSPFGPVVTVPASPDTIVNIAQLPGVQGVAPAYPRKVANDLSRPRLGVSADSLATTAPYLGLSGSNVLININDTGVDNSHPDLMGRITSDLATNLTDANGHGTHVAGTILGTGFESATVINAIGSVTNASFRGMATNANAYVLNINTSSDSYLQEQAARTNALISNNSWGYGDSAYDIEAASYDAAVRDALPEVTGPQSLIFVFSAGNGGSGTDDGQNGSADSISSPGTAKNVITVGAIEQLRNITNMYTNISVGVTNVIQPFLGDTDTDNQVADFSSRGNVGIGVEGSTGRFKPDVVAPGTFVISCRSSQWNTNAYYNPTNVVVSYYPNQSVATNNFAPYIYPVPANPVQMIITVLTNSQSPSPFPLMPIYVALNQAPTTANFVSNNQVALPTGSLALNYGDTVYFTVGNGTNTTVNFDLEIQVLETNGDPVYLAALDSLNNSLGAPTNYYRYESGTSMAAAGISGMLACMEEFFNQRLHISNASPALMKAMLINGARGLSSPGQPYDFQVASSINYQGWGLPNLPNSIPAALTNYSGGNESATTTPVIFFDQNPTNALATGQSTTSTLQLTPTAVAQPLRVTLVWTDPPGNPNVGIKLVNNLVLIVTNLATGDVYYGNDIPGGSIYNEIASTNSPAPIDVVNNVQNVYLPPSTGTNFSITVWGRNVNVNAVTLNTNNVVQDYALVISSGDAGAIPSPFASYTPAPLLVSSNNVSPVTTLTNGIPLLNQRIGANSQYAATTNGITNQWNFYVYTNTASITNGTYTNVAFITFFPPNLGVPRMEASGEIDPSNTNATRFAGADVDLYVSTSPALTNLDPTVISNAFAQGTVSVNRNGDQTVVFTNSASGQVYYIGIKSEDQEGAQYGFAGVASNIPFNQMDSNGNTLVTMMPLPATIPGGSPASPQYALIFGVSTQTALARKVTVTETVTSQNFGDFIGTLSHNQTFDTLNNHTYFTNANDTTETFIYDDSGDGTTPNPKHSDGPGSLQNFTGTSVAGSWIFTMVNDSSPTDTGSISAFQITIAPQPPTNGVTDTLLGSQWYYDFIDVPENCTNLTVFVLDDSPNAAPLELVIKRGTFPTLTDYDKLAIINPPSGSISISTFDSPPLNPGRYYIGVYNPNAAAVTFTLSESLGISTTPGVPFEFLSIGNEPIPDDAVMYSTNYVGLNSPVVSAEVGVRINHPRISDLVMTLISPEGTRVLLAENRGGLTTNYGSGFNTTNFQAPTLSGNATASTNYIALTPVNGQTSGTLGITYNFYTVPDDMRIYYNGVRIFDSGLISYTGTFAVNFGPGTATNLEIIMNEPGTNPSTNTTDEWEYAASVITVGTTYAVFTENTNETTLPIKFAVPPFASSPSYTPPVTVLTSGFEGYIGGYYTAVDGWTTLDTNPVEVVTVPALANTGTNVLALHQGSIIRSVPTVPGTTYTLTFAAHGRPYLIPVSWWKLEGSNEFALDSGPGGNTGVAYNGTWVPGLVGNAFDCIYGFFCDVNVSNAPDLMFTNMMTTEVWIYPTNIGIGTNYSILTKFDITPGGNDAYSLGIDAATGRGIMQITSDGFDISGSVLTASVIPANQWTHLASTYDGTNLNIYFNGTLQGTTVPSQEGIYPGTDALGIGATVGGAPAGNASNPFVGLIDEATVYSNSLSILQIQDIYAAGSAGKVGSNDSLFAHVILNLPGITTNIAANDTWTNYSFTFTATSDNTAVEFNNRGDGILLDSFTLVQNAEVNSNNYFLPEESLSKVVGENALGAWQLEVLDNRAGPAVTNPAPLLVSWELSLFTETTTPTASPLSFGIAQSNTVPPNSIVYYIVNVPPWASFATNTLFNVSGGALNLLFNQNYEPGTTTNGGDYALLTDVGTRGATAVLATNPANGTPAGLPPLLPGTSYYLGVQNTNQTPVNFSIVVYFNIPVLTNMVPVTNTLAASSIPQYYQFNVTNGGVAVSFQLLNLTGNMNLVVSDGPPLPTLSAYAYNSTYFGNSTETIIVVSNSQPVPLAPGTWYLGVFNNDVVTEPYTILASEYGPPTIIYLTNMVPYIMTNFPPGPELSTFFGFVIPTNSSAALFEIYNMSGNVGLTVDPAPNFPYGPQYFASSFNPGTTLQQVVVRTNPALNGVFTTNLSTSNIWYLGAPNQTASNVTFTILAEVTSNGILPSPIAPTLGVTNPTNTLTFTWGPTVAGQTYDIIGTTNLAFPLTNWTNVATVSNAPANPPYLQSYVDTNAINGVPYMFYSILQVFTP